MRSKRLYCLPAAPSEWAHGRICACRGAAHIDPNLQADGGRAGPGRTQWTHIMADIYWVITLLARERFCIQSTADLLLRLSRILGRLSCHLVRRGERVAFFAWLKHATSCLWLHRHILWVTGIKTEGPWFDQENGLLRLRDTAVVVRLDNLGF